MWLIIIPLITGYAFAALKGPVAARLPVKALTTVSLVLLLVVMGGRIGADPEIIAQIAAIGVAALALAAATVAGSVAVLLLLQVYLRSCVAAENGRLEAGNGHGLTLLLMVSVAAGIGLGRWLMPPQWLPALTELAVWLLGLLLLAVGLDLGQAKGAFGSLRRLGARIILLTLGVAAGSIAAAVVLTALWGNLVWQEAAALASGFGWYSLSAVLLSELHSPLLGALAFLANVFRELIALVITPVLARYAGPIAAIGPGGATTMDVMLPVIARGVGREYVPLAFFSGAVLSLSVAVLVNLFMGLL